MQQIPGGSVSSVAFCERPVEAIVLPSNHLGRGETAYPPEAFISGEEKLMEKLLQIVLNQIIKKGAIEIQTPRDAFYAGDGGDAECAIRFVDQGAAVGLMRNPEFAFGELYMDGRIELVRGTIYDVLALATRNISRAELPQWIRLLRWARNRLPRLSQKNDLRCARRNAEFHYDLGEQLYSLFLDDDRQYSCAYFERPDIALDAAQKAKLRHVAAKLVVQPNDEVLDIGCGWGGLGLYLARYCGARVTGVTLSGRQLEVARQRARQARLAKEANFRLEDYRNIEGRFDRIVSIGMFEHVGVDYYDAFFAKIAALLDDNGIALISTIGHMDEPGATNAWVTKHIFPGGHIPALSEIIPSVERSRLVVTDIEALRIHYAETLAHWRARFSARREEAKALYGERFCRMWEFYLAGAECAFRFGRQVVFQLQLARSADAVPITRDYIIRREQQLRALEGASEPREGGRGEPSSPPVGSRAGDIILATGRDGASRTRFCAP
jgi:cyclopropane-fatty-acyl-phospholipid synthase